jgi:hypothetical protein
MRWSSWRLVAPVVLVTAALSGAATQASPEPSSVAAGCARQFDVAIDKYTGAHPTRDIDQLASVLHDDWTVIFPDGELLLGKEEGLAWVRDEFFNDPSWTQSFDEIRRVVRGCKTGFVLFDSIYEQPGYRTHLLIGLSLTYEHGRWLVVQDQNTRVEDA